MNRVLKNISMTDRQQKILQLVVREYVRTAVPVGSKNISEILDCSSATIRNEMSELERMGYLAQPHTSAGRIPTDAGYRYYVNLLLDGRDLSRREQEDIQTELLKLKAQNTRLARFTSKLLSNYADSLAVTSIGSADDFATSGAKHLLETPEFEDRKQIADVFEAVDEFEEVLNMMKQKKDASEKSTAVSTFIGAENPVKEMQNCSLVMSEFELPSGEKGVVAILGPKRMEYKRNISLVEYMTKLLGSGGLVIIMLINFM